METMTLTRRDVSTLSKHFEALNAKVPLHPISTPEEYDAAVQALNALLDAGVADERHPLASLVAVLGELIGDYDDLHYRLPEVTSAQMLRFLMEQHGLTQSDLREIGTQGVVSEILNGKRELNLRQIKVLAQRFHVSPAVFM